MIDTTFERWADQNAGFDAAMDAAGDDPIAQLSAHLRAAGLHASLDSGRSFKRPCTFCGTDERPRELVRIGRYGDGSSIERPVCEPCKPLADARQKPRLREGWPS